MLGRFGFRKLTDIAVVEALCRLLCQGSIIYSGKDKATCRRVRAAGRTAACRGVAAQTYPHVSVPLDGSAVGKHHVRAGPCAGADELAVNEVADDVACPVHRDDKMIEFPGNSNRVASQILHGTGDATLVLIRERAGKCRVVERPTSILFAPEEGSLGYFAALVCQPLKANQRLPCDTGIECFGQRGILIVQGIEVICSRHLSTAVICIVGFVVKGGSLSARTYLCIKDSFVDNTVCIEGKVEQAFRRLCLIFLPKVGGDDLLCYQFPVYVIGHQCCPCSGRMQLVQGIEVPI